VVLYWTCKPPVCGSFSYTIEAAVPEPWQPRKRPGPGRSSSMRRAGPVVVGLQLES
jgi:hypothetical protein